MKPASGKEYKNPEKTFPKRRVNLSEFFNMTGRALFPDTWSGGELAAYSQQKRSGGQDDLIHRGFLVSQELERAIGEGEIVVEVDLLRLDRPGSEWSKFTWSEEEEDEKDDDDSETETDEEVQYRKNKHHLVYTPTSEVRLYTVEADHTIEYDWLHSFIKVQGRFLSRSAQPETGRPKKYTYIRGRPTIKDVANTVFKLKAFVKEPIKTLEKLLNVPDAAITTKILKRYSTARAHFWGEIVAAVWRVIAIKGLNPERGALKLLVLDVQEYLRSQGLAEAIPLSQLNAAVSQVLQQYEAGDVVSTVLPKFSRRPPPVPNSAKVKS